MSTNELCLSRKEMRELCGTPLKDRQFAFLRANGIRHYKGLDDRPRVLRSTIEGVGDEAAAKAIATWKPNKAA